MLLKHYYLNFYTKKISCLTVTKLLKQKLGLRNLEANHTHLQLFNQGLVLVAKLGLTPLRPHGRRVPRQAPLPMDFPGNTGVSCPFLLQGIFPTQGLNPGLLRWQAYSLPPSHLESPGLVGLLFKFQNKAKMCS